MHDLGVKWSIGVLLVAGLSSGAVSCTGGDSGLSRVPASSFFNPAEVNYGLRTVGQRHEVTMLLRNGSTNTLRVQETRFDPARDVYQALLTEGGTLRGTLLSPGESREVTMVYFPITEGDDDTTMIVQFDDIEVTLPITAKARLVAPARPELNPTNLEFLPTAIGLDAVEVVTVRNIGDTHGSIDAVRGQRGPFTVTAIGGGPLDLPTPALAPGESTQMEVHYRPTTEAPLSASLVFEMDTDTSEILSVTGRAVEAGVLMCDQITLDFGTVPRGEKRRLPVSCSASGGPYELEDLRVVPGSAAGFTIPNAPTELDGTRAISFEVEFDAGGLPRRYEGALEIVAAHGTVTRVPVIALTTPPLAGTTDLTVKIEWNTARSDIDLHVVRVGGTPFSMGNDCYYEDRNPDWGVTSTEIDDPFLDEDDVDGLGPEEMNLTNAAEAQYEVYAFYHQYTGAFAPSTMVTATYRLRNTAPVMISFDLNECGGLLHIGTAYFDTGLPRFVPNGTVSDTYKVFAHDICNP